MVDFDRVVELSLTARQILESGPLTPEELQDRLGLTGNKKVFDAVVLQLQSHFVSIPMEDGVTRWFHKNLAAQYYEDFG